jgi:hypothetical protein
MGVGFLDRVVLVYLLGNMAKNGIMPKNLSFGQIKAHGPCFFFRHLGQKIAYSGE